MINITNKSFNSSIYLDDKNKLSNVDHDTVQKTAKISYASILKTNNIQPLPKVKQGFVKISVENFPTWILNNHTAVKNFAHSYKAGYKKIQKFSYMPRVLDWHERPQNHLATPNYHHLDLDIQDWSIFIHSFPKVFDALIGSSFTSVCDSLWKKNLGQPDTKVLQFVSVVRVYRPEHTYQSLLIPEKETTGWHIFGIGAENFALYHKCFDESTADRPTGNAENYGWNQLIPYLKNNTPSSKDPINLAQIEGYVPGYNQLQIFYSESQKHLTFVFPDKTVYRFYQIYPSGSQSNIKV